ncbi:MAG: nucleotidyltransferase domain-containing protein [Candidatus Harrisonbacteria bacterium]|nr:nucleotidyltransferase domain-containing protein [Candidatus Harrisonbacteria bacterium]
MKLEHYSLERLQREIGAIVWKYLAREEYKVYFFGSRVTGNSSERSDIDVGIEGAATVPPVMMAKIRDEITELPTLYNIDVVDMRAASPAFRRIAKQQIELISHE